MPSVATRPIIPAMSSEIDNSAPKRRRVLGSFTMRLLVVSGILLALYGLVWVVVMIWYAKVYYPGFPR